MTLREMRSALVVALALCVGAWAATEWIAWRLHFHPHLGPALWRSHWAAWYSPTRFLVWEFGYRHVPWMMSIRQQGLLVFGVATMIVLGVAALVMPHGPHPPAVSGSSGTAAWGTGHDLTSEHGLVLGRLV